jgi:hypothetical protein
MTDFRKKYNFEERLNLSKNIISKYEDKLPIYLSFDKEILSIVDPLFKKNINRYIVTSTLSIVQFLSIVKKKLNIKPEESLTLFIEIYNNQINQINQINQNNEINSEKYSKSLFNSDKITESILCPLSATIESIYTQYKDIDNFLYFRLIKENVFG